MITTVDEVLQLCAGDAGVAEIVIAVDIFVPQGTLLAGLGDLDPQTRRKLPRRVGNRLSGIASILIQVSYYVLEPRLQRTMSRKSCSSSCSLSPSCRELRYPGPGGGSGG